MCVERARNVELFRALVLEERPIIVDRAAESSSADLRRRWCSRPPDPHA